MRRDEAELRARRTVERMALALQGALLVEAAPNFVADAFCSGRLSDAGGRELGTLPSGLALDEVVERATPLA